MLCARHPDFPFRALQDWWATFVNVPNEAVAINFAFTNGIGKWDSNGGFNYSMPVVSALDRGHGRVQVRSKAQLLMEYCCKA
jgi:hypothetical protein